MRPRFGVATFEPGWIHATGLHSTNAVVLPRGLVACALEPSHAFPSSPSRAVIQLSEPEHETPSDLPTPSGLLQSNVGACAVRAADNRRVTGSELGWTSSTTKMRRRGGKASEYKQYCLHPYYGSIPVGLFFCKKKEEKEMSNNTVCGSC